MRSIRCLIVALSEYFPEALSWVDYVFFSLREDREAREFEVWKILCHNCFLAIHFLFLLESNLFFFFNVKALYMLCSSFAGIIMESFWDTHGENLVGFLVWPCKHYSLPESHCCSRWISNSSSNCHLIAPFSLLFQGLVVACFLMCLSLQISG